MKGVSFYIVLAGLILSLMSCNNNDYVPKPRGYFRIDFPNRHYIKYDTTCPYTFYYPAYAKIRPDQDPLSEPCWINLEFPDFNGVLHISYKPIKNNLSAFFEDARIFVNKHIPKADDIIQTPIVFDSHEVWGIKYEIEGTGVASAYQFCVTDSLHHYIRGALYFNALPNNDSLAPVLNFVKEDIDHLINTLSWK